MKPSPIVAILMLTICAAMRPDSAHAIPYFARKYNVSCSQCHVQPPKLNAFGEEFRSRGYQMPGLVGRRTVPFAIWASGRSDALHDEQEVRDAVAAYVNKLEVISGGQAVVPWLSYFVEWRPVSLETTKRNGVVQLRDRAGRFEDIYLTASARNLAVTVGQFRQMEQVDVSLRLGLSEPLVLSASLPGSAEGLPVGPDGKLTARGSRQQSLRGFSPSGRSPSVRVGWNQEVSSGWRWTTLAALPFPGEFSIPLTDEARVEASNEFESDHLKGVVLESFVRRGLMSVGGHVFYDNADRYLANLVTTGNRGHVYWTGIGGVEKAAAASGLRGRWSVEAEYVPHYFLGLGGRVENRAADGAKPAFVPYFRSHFPGSRYTVYLGLERRFQEGRDATLLEFGTVF
jgi:hypothetical protein